MAESFGFNIVKYVVGKLGDLLLEEAIFLHGVEDRVSSLRDQLQWILSFLVDADRCIKDTERMKTLMSQVRLVAYDAEDAIDTYVLKIEQHRRRSHGFLGPLRSCVHMTAHASILHDLGVQIDGIQRRVKEISDNRSTFGIESITPTPIGEASSSSSNQRLAWRSNRAQDVEEVDVVGFNEDVTKLVRQLIGGEARRVVVVSIVGMGGLGKTTLANKVYSNNEVKRQFDCQSWVSVSQKYRVRELLQEIVGGVMSISRKEMENMTDEDLELKLSDYLRSRKYLVVIDDIWRIEDWDGIKSIFPEGMNGSRVMLTTRIKDVALYADNRTMPHELKFLGEEESWRLFCIKAVGDTGCPANLEDLGRGIAAKCGGLPLAIVVLGGLVSRKEQSREEWGKVLKSVDWELIEGKYQIKRILALSYNELPYYLKPCFLYFSLFPEDSKIKAKKLIAYWVAEEFIQARGEKIMEEVAEDYLEELIHSSMIQVVERNSYGRVRTCQIHDLLLDLSILEAKGEKFLHVPDEPPAGRRLALRNGTGEYISSSSLPTRNLRSLLLFDRTVKRLEKSFIHSIKMLRVLDLYGTEIRKLPDDIGQLIHLRYLGLQWTNIKVIPSFIGRLRNLQTLDMRYSLIWVLPSAIWKLQNLRHILGRRLSFHGMAEFNGLTNLQTLSYTFVGPWVESRLVKMTNLRKLDIRGVGAPEYNKPLSESIVKFEHLNILKLQGIFSDFGSKEILNPFLQPKDLHVLYLDGELGRLPKSEEFPTNLTKITLRFSELHQDPMPTLGKLSSLQILRLWNNSFMGKEMICSERGFPELRMLELGILNELEVWKIEEEAMPVLRHLVIDNCKKLKMLPEGLQRITTLKKLTLVEMPVEFISRVREGEGEDWDKIRHVPSLTVIK